jgi:hypothetical protein
MSCHIPELVADGSFDALDLTGWNYMRRYARYREKYPDRPVIYSESASAFSTRGYYDPDLPDRATDYPDHFQMSSYDLGAAPWADIPDAEFRLMEQDRFVAGEFVWTGFDYLGEPTPFTDPARSSYFGVVDLCGLPKDRFYLYRSHWRPDVPTVHLLPHWNWPDRVGRNVPVFVYTNGDSAELFLNGRSLGLRRKGEVPPRPPNLALQGAATASSSAPGQGAAAAADGDLATEWRPQPDAGPAWWQIDLGRTQTVAQLSVDTPRKENAYAYAIEASTDGERWTRLLHHPTQPYPQWNGPTRIRHRLDPIEARFLRLVLEEATGDAPPGLKEFMAFSEAAENDYYDVTYDYRLRWNEVTYEPGELRAVAYRDGQVLGEAVVETTGAPAALRLTADRNRIAADGEDLVFITAEALDAAGRPHPLAENLVHFSVDGPAQIAAVGNGNPLSFESFLADRQQLFYGKALLILRPQSGPGGDRSARSRNCSRRSAPESKPRILIRASSSIIPESTTLVAAEKRAPNFGPVFRCQTVGPSVCLVQVAVVEEVTGAGNARNGDNIVEGKEPIGSQVFASAAKDLVIATTRQLCCKVEGRAKALGVNSLQGVLGIESAHTIVVPEMLLAPLRVQREAFEFLAGVAKGDNIQTTVQVATHLDGKRSTVREYTVPGYERAPAVAIISEHR